MEWSDNEKFLAELKKTILLKNACLDLREEFDEYQSERLNLICKSSLPKNRNSNREIPSRKVGWGEESDLPGPGNKTLLYLNNTQWPTFEFDN